MNDTRDLLEKIKALRYRLEHAHGLMRSTGRGAREAEQQDALQSLRDKVTVGSQHATQLQDTLQDFSDDDVLRRQAMLPSRLTVRGHRLVRRGRGLLESLRALADEPCLQEEHNEAVALLYRQTAAMLDSVLRTMQAFPETTSAQLRLCDGLEATLDTVADQLETLKSGVGRGRLEADRLDQLTTKLTAVARGMSVSLDDFSDLAESLLDEARQGLPLRFYTVSPIEHARYIAGHSLMVASVAARLIHDDPSWRDRLERVMLAGLLFDVGMLSVSPQTLAYDGPLNEAQWREVEHHTRAGAKMLQRLGAGEWLQEVALKHHEREDGTGYPSGFGGRQIRPLVKLITVCDVYSALCVERPYRNALGPRAAVTDILLLAEQGGLDRSQTERLLRLGFYPVGSAVELDDGTKGIVVANDHVSRAADPGRPLVVLLADEQGCPLPLPHHIDLKTTKSRSIIRSLFGDERLQLLGKRFPLYA